MFVLLFNTIHKTLKKIFKNNSYYCVDKNHIIIDIETGNH
jgi:hypothetical protein